MLLETDTTDSVLFPALAVGADRTPAAAWQYDNCTVWANVYH